MHRFFRSFTLLLLCALLLSACGAAKPEPTPEPEPSAEPTVCPHPSWTDGVCDACGAPCEHPSWADGVCVTCGTVCAHPVWADGACTRCGTVCPHPAWVEGACAVCGRPCAHPSWTEGCCAVCALPCSHPSWAGGVCTVCGTVCAHSAYDPETRLCTVCGEPCLHPYHDPDTRLCASCGALMTHRFTEGRCAVCGAAPISFSGALPERYYEEAEQRGGVTSYSYSAADETGAEFTRRMLIYTPPGYDASQPCNILILLHGAGDDERGWLTMEHAGYGRQFEIRTIFDRMHEEKLIDPVIIASVALDASYASRPGSTSYEGLARELREIILPYLAQNYATYAGGGSLEELREARRHIALGGLSMGATYVYASGLERSLDLIGSFVCLSGSDSADAVLRALNDPAFSPYTIYLCYAAAGTSDMARSSTTDCFRAIVDGWPWLTEGENAFFHLCEGGHEWPVWSTEMFNALQLCFQDEA